MLVPSSTSRSALVVLHHFDGLLRCDSAGLLHPAAGHGVRRVSRFMRRSGEPVGQHSRSPHRGFGPSEEYHPSTAVPRHRGRCPLGVSARLRDTSHARIGRTRCTSRLLCLLRRPDCGECHQARSATHVCRRFDHSLMKPPPTRGPKLHTTAPEQRFGLANDPGESPTGCNAEASTHHLLAEGHADKSARVNQRWGRRPHTARASPLWPPTNPRAGRAHLPANRMAVGAGHP